MHRSTGPAPDRGTDDSADGCVSVTQMTVEDEDARKPAAVSPSPTGGRRGPEA
jgi:hypothetical protein